MVHLVEVDVFMVDSARAFVFTLAFSLLEWMFSWLTRLERLFSCRCFHGSFC